MSVKLNKKGENFTFSQEVVFGKSVGDLLKNSIKTTDGLDTKKSYICIAGVGDLSSKEKTRLKAEKAFNFKEIGNFLISNVLNIVSKQSLDTVFNSDVYIAENEHEINFVGGCREYNRHGITNIRGVIVSIYFIDTEVYKSITNKAVEELTAEIKKADAETSAKAEKSAEEKKEEGQSKKRTAKKNTVAKKAAAV